MIPWEHHVPAPVTGGPQQGHHSPASGQFKDLSRYGFSLFVCLGHYCLNKKGKKLTYKDEITKIGSFYKRICLKFVRIWVRPGQVKVFWV